MSATDGPPSAAEASLQRSKFAKSAMSGNNAGLPLELRCLLLIIGRRLGADRSRN